MRGVAQIKRTLLLVKLKWSSSTQLGPPSKLCACCAACQRPFLQGLDVFTLHKRLWESMDDHTGKCNPKNGWGEMKFLAIEIYCWKNLSERVKIRFSSDFRQSCPVHAGLTTRNFLASLITYLNAQVFTWRKDYVMMDWVQLDWYKRAVS